jgi:hypothetical protein
MSLGVGKYGLTLTNAKTAIYYEKSFDSDSYWQSVHRIRRIGLNHIPVLVTLTSPNSTDEIINKNLSGKLASIAKLTNADLAGALRGIKK